MPATTHAAGPGDQQSAARSDSLESKAASTGDPPAPMGQGLKEIWRELPGLLTDRVDLLALEIKRAGAALVKLAMLVVAATVLIVTVWLLAWATAITAMVGAGLPVAVALALMLAVNAAALWWAWLRAQALLKRVNLSATFRHLTDFGQERPEAPPDGANPARSNSQPVAGRAVGAGHAG